MSYFCSLEYSSSILYVCVCCLFKLSHVAIGWLVQVQQPLKDFLLQLSQKSQLKAAKFTAETILIAAMPVL